MMVQTGEARKNRHALKISDILASARPSPNRQLPIARRRRYVHGVLCPAFWKN